MFHQIAHCIAWLYITTVIKFLQLNSICNNELENITFVIRFQQLDFSKSWRNITTVIKFKQLNSSYVLENIYLYFGRTITYDSCWNSFEILIFHILYNWNWCWSHFVTPLSILSLKIFWCSLIDYDKHYHFVCFSTFISHRLYGKTFVKRVFVNIFYYRNWRYSHCFDTSGP